MVGAVISANVIKTDDVLEMPALTNQCHQPKGKTKPAIHTDGGKHPRQVRANSRLGYPHCRRNFLVGLVEQHKLRNAGLLGRQAKLADKRLPSRRFKWKWRLGNWWR